MKNSYSLLKKCKIRGSVLHIEVECPNFRNDWSGILLVYMHKAEKDKEEIFIPARRKQTESSVVLCCDIDFRKVQLRQTHWEIFAVCGERGEKFASQVAKPHEKEKKDLVSRIKSYMELLKKDYYVSGGNILFICTKRRNDYDLIRLRYRPVTDNDYTKVRVKEILAQILYSFNRQKYEDMKIWLIYEKKCTNAQDNGYYFFKYCMDNNMEEKLGRSIYYVIDKRSPSYKKVASYENNVVDFMSLKHMKYIIAARLLISTDARNHGFIWQYNKSLLWKYFDKKKFVFLGHGILAIKKLNSGFRAHAMNAVMTTATSDMEGDIFVNELYYPRPNVAITGYSRFDALEDKSQGRKEILVMPTHRPELYQVERRIFVESEYCHRYMDILNDDELDRVLKETGTTLNFYLHPSICEHTPAFSSKSENIKIINYGDIPLDDLMMQCNLLVTDYSSVSWDVFYMGKPIIFYQYDMEEYTKGWDSYVDLKKDMPGDRVETHDELINAIIEYIKCGFKLKPEYEQLRNKRYKYFDNNNSERICQELKERKL